MNKENQNRNKELEEMKKEYQKVEAESAVRDALEQRMREAIQDKRRNKRARAMRASLSAAAALCVLIALPNTTAGIANAMGSLPVVGELFRVVTFRDYHAEDEHSYADVKVPQIETEPSDGAEETSFDQDLGEASENESYKEQAPAEDETPDSDMEDETAVEAVNKSVEEYTEELITRFEEETDQAEGGYQGLDVTYEVVTDTDTWFTLRLDIVETSASGYQYSKFYHIDKVKDQVVSLSDLFAPGSDYVTRISDYIKEEMRRRMREDENQVYWIDSEEAFADDDFKQIREDQNFYFDSDGTLVIVFDEYEVAPGYMGTVEFPIPDGVIRDMMAQR